MYRENRERNAPETEDRVEKKAEALPVHVEKSGDRLKTSERYEANGYHYETDKRGRIVRAEGTLPLQKETKDDATDWDRTSLRPEEETILRDMEESGEIDFQRENPNLENPKSTELHLPSEKTGDFLGERGNSQFRPNSEKAMARMREYGTNAVEYKDGRPDFSPFTMHDSQWGEINGQVEIGHMTDQRKNPAWEYGRRPHGTGHDPNRDLGNFAQADNALAAQLQTTHPEVKGEDIEEYRKANHLTWHECADGKTMQLVPEEIHASCPHGGGVSEMKYRMAWGDITRPSG